MDIDWISICGSVVSVVKGFNQQFLPLFGLNLVKPCILRDNLASYPRKKNCSWTTKICQNVDLTSRIIDFFCGKESEFSDGWASNQSTKKPSIWTHKHVDLHLKDFESWKSHMRIPQPQIVSVHIQKIETVRSCHKKTVLAQKTSQILGRFHHPAVLGPVLPSSSQQLAYSH